MTRAITWSPEAVARLRKMHAADMPVSLLAERFGVSEGAIMAKLGGKRYPNKTPYVSRASVPVRMIVSPPFIDPVDGLLTRIVKGI